MADTNASLVKEIEARGIRTKKVLDAMQNVDRKHFVPEDNAAASYADFPVPIGAGQTISQPYIVAFMTEQLDIEPDDRVLEVGTGSGYQLAILTELTPHVYGIEKRKKLVDLARHNLEQAGYKAAHIRQGDGYEGWPEQAPFDKIIVTAAAVHVPPPLINQLAPEGRMIIPVGRRCEVQLLVLLRKDKKGNVRSKSLEPVRFVPMVGRAQNENSTGI